MLLIILLILIIIYILYVLIIKYSYNIEYFDNDTDNKNDYGLIKYSSINIDVSDNHKLQILFNNLSELFYIKVIDTHINNINDLINKINENIQETITKTNKQYLNDNIYISIYPNINFNKIDNTIFTKIIIIYPNYYEKNNKLIYNNNMQKFNQYFKENNFGGNITIYKIDKNNKIFNHYLQ